MPIGEPRPGAPFSAGQSAARSLPKRVPDPWADTASREHRVR